MLKALEKNEKWQGRRGPLVLVIMDGVGYGKYREGDAVQESHMEALENFSKTCPLAKLKAHGTAVGLPSDDDMGNSEVGHNAMGCGRVFAQGAKLVSDSIDSGFMFEGETWKKLIENAKKNNATLHFIGLFSDGNVHSHIDHLKAMLTRAEKEGIKRARIHTLLDGRDVGETSALEYIDPFELFLEDLNAKGVDYRIGSGGGRMYITMDRYGADWSMVERGWKVHVLGEGRQFASAREAVESWRREIPGIIDQDMKEFVIAENGKPIGTIEDGDSVIYFNFRGDRALEITAAFESPEYFEKFDRIRVPKVEYAGMMEYDGDLHIPSQYLVTPPAIDRTVGEYLCASGVRQLAISETQKYGHVTYFFNGNRLGKFDENLETYVEIKSDVLPFEQRPWMKCAEITDYVLDAVKSGEYDFIRLNYPNGDMVGHTGVYQAVICSMEGMDLQLARLKKAVAAAGGIMLITADHGNADDMFEHDKKTGDVSRKADGTPRAKTSHSLNPVPCIVFDPESKDEYSRDLKTGLGISSIGATCIELLGLKAPEGYDPSVLNFS
ncbi:2,3-bisphosphoglycerate-independent phosphoglycerate mutase [Brucepastera parasyntrophica]|uniref:2,3-bisphosphoglycerate-independent phosphoglycerate mutase n=1 Tax=Brucepastera parasyntrophica TaxID=2880008 RepID=UPI00210B9DBA|nr:2,3-bisphosphoglycerate-independent phosphoglycerate mutase [Brucepastera parasyntrophica]ULQ60614.1 2,3-bisphosphoglycerate-independent phosphoglycerate mutase [Brucepastera parasyntrophica]